MAFHIVGMDSHWIKDIEIYGRKSAKFWALHSRISQNMYLTLKYRNKTYQTQELSIREYNAPFKVKIFQRVEHKETLSG